MPREVLVFHYGWWGTKSGTGQRRHWGTPDESGPSLDNTAHFPAGGVYDSQDPEVIARQLDAVRTAGATGVIASWWGAGTFEDRTLDLLAPAIEREGLKLCAYYEAVPCMALDGDQAAQVEAVAADVAGLLDRYASRSSWLRIANRPVLFVYARALEQLGPEGWRRVSRRLQGWDNPPLLIADLSGGTGLGEAKLGFAGVHIYNDSARTAGRTLQGVARWARYAYPRRMRRWTGLIRCLAIHPGFDARKATGRVDPGAVTSRHGGETLRVLGEAAVAAKPEWLLVTSWNEWHEGTEIEPSSEHGIGALTTMRDISARFLQLPAGRIYLPVA